MPLSQIIRLGARIPLQSEWIFVSTILVHSQHRAALNALCRTLAVEEENITFVAVRPGVMDTDMQNHLLDNGRSTCHVRYLSRSSFACI